MVKPFRVAPRLRIATPFHHYGLRRIALRELNGKDVEDVDEFLVYRLVDVDGFIYRNIDNLVILDTYHYVPLSVLERLDGRHTQTAGENTVLSRRATSPLQMSEYGYTGLIFRIFLEQTVSIILSSARTVLLALGHQYD